MKIIPQDFDYNVDIATVLKRLYLVTGMTATIYNSKKYWVTSYPLYNCSYCNSLRQNNDYHMRCRANDAEAFEMCAKKRETIIYRCYMGLYEIMIPLFDLDNICGYLLLGQAMEDGDDLLPQAIEIAISMGNISTSMVQRRLGVGYARAGRIIDQMEQRGIISGPDGAKPRKVLVSSDYLDN